MKIKLENYSLISNSQLDFILECLGWTKDNIKQQLIPSQKLAEKCFDAVNSTNTKSWSNTSSITCVPCDSLKKVEIK